MADPQIDHFYETVARNLVAEHGQAAFRYARSALRRMRALNYEEGFEMWQSIYASLQMLAAPVDVEEEITAVH